MLRVRSHLVRRAALSVAGTALAVAGAAGAASAATVTQVASNLTSPSGSVDATTATGAPSTWVADHLLGFCRLDGGALNQATCLTSAVAPGEPVFDAVHQVAYVPDLSAKSLGVWRYLYNPSTNRFGSATLLSLTNSQAGNRPAGTALDGSGNLYYTTLKSNGVLRVTSPWLANASQTQTRVGQSSDGRGVPRLTFLNDTLYLAQNASVTSISGVSACTASASCVATPAGIAFTPRSLATDGVDTIYVGTNFDVEAYTVSAGGPTTQVAPNFANAAGLAVRSDGSLLVGDDPTDGAQSLQGRLWRVTVP